MLKLCTVNITQVQNSPVWSGFGVAIFKVVNLAPPSGRFPFSNFENKLEKEIFMKNLMLAGVMVLSIQALAQTNTGGGDTGSASVETVSIGHIKDQQSHAKDTRIALKTSYYYGHDAGRSTSPKHIEELSYDNATGKCELIKSSPGFFTDQHNYDKNDAQESLCRPLAVAKNIKSKLGSCKSRAITMGYNNVRGKSFGYLSLQLTNDCVCYLSVSYTEWSKLRTLLNPLSSLFNGPDYIKVDDSYALDKEECASLHTSEAAKEIVREAYDNVK